MPVLPRETPPRPLRLLPPPHAQKISRRMLSAWKERGKRRQVREREGFRERERKKKSRSSKEEETSTSTSLFFPLFPLQNRPTTASLATLDAAFAKVSSSQSSALEALDGLMRGKEEREGEIGTEKERGEFFLTPKKLVFCLSPQKKKKKKKNRARRVRGSSLHPRHAVPCSRRRSGAQGEGPKGVSEAAAGLRAGRASGGGRRRDPEEAATGNSRRDPRRRRRTQRHFVPLVVRGAFEKKQKKHPCIIVKE